MLTLQSRVLRRHLFADDIHSAILGYCTGPDSDFHKRVFNSCRLHSICRQIGRDVTTRPVTVIILEFLTIPQR